MGARPASAIKHKRTWALCIHTARYDQEGRGQKKEFSSHVCTELCTKIKAKENGDELSKGQIDYCRLIIQTPLIIRYLIQIRVFKILIKSKDRQH